MVRSSRQGALPTELGPLIDDLDDLKRRIARLEQPSGESLGNVLPRTLATLYDLAGRESHFQREPDLFQSWTRDDSTGGFTQFGTPLGSILSFTLQEARLVRIVVTMSLSASFTANSTTRSGSAGIGATTIIDDVYGATADEVDQIFADVSAGDPITRRDAASTRARVERYIELPAGSHTVQAALNTVQVNASGTGAWNAYITVAAPVIAVDVLQPVTIEIA